MRPIAVWAMYSMKKAVLETFPNFIKSFMQSSPFLTKSCRLLKPQIRYEGAQSAVGIYMFKVNNRNTRTRCEICSKLKIKTPERRLHFLAFDFKQLLWNHQIFLLYNFWVFSLPRQGLKRKCVMYYHQNYWLCVNRK